MVGLGYNIAIGFFLSHWSLTNQAPMTQALDMSWLAVLFLFVYFCNFVLLKNKDN